MTIVAAVTVLAAFLSTIITAIAIQAHWTATQKRIASGIVALILGALSAIATNQIDGLPVDWVTTVGKWLVMAGTIAALAQGVYSQFKGLLSNLEEVTTFTPPPVTEDVTTDADSTDSANGDAS